jgi:hypothetical protein
MLLGRGMEAMEAEKRYVGLDVAKRTMEVCTYAFLLARYLQAAVGCVVYILNPGKLRMIWQSTKKTD